MKLRVVFASETGRSEEIGRDVGEWLAACVGSARVSVESIADYDAGRLADEEAVLVLCVSTAGQGDVVSSMQRFWRFVLQRRLPAALHSLRYCVLGLGDSQYPHFNFAARRLDARLQQLGGQRVQQRVWLLDEQQPLQPQLIAWRRDLWTALQLPTAPAVLPLLPLLPRRSLRLLSAPQSPCSSPKLPFESALVVDRQHIAANVTLVTLAIETAPGDVLEVWPSESAEEIASLIEQLGLEADAVVRCDEPQPWDGWRVMDVLTYALDPFAPCTGAILRVAAAMSSYEGDQLEALHSLAGDSWSADAQAYLRLRSAADVLRELRARVTFPQHFSALFGCLAPRRPREYSVAGCRDGRTQLLVCETVTADGPRVRRGRVSEALRKGPQNSFGVRRRAGRLAPLCTPDADAAPVLLIAGGAGLASVLSLIEAREQRTSSADRSVWHMYQGCRTEQLMAEQIAHFQQCGALQQCHVAISRPSRTYVTHLLLRDSASVFELFLKGKAFIVVAGSISSGFARDVRSALLTLVKEGTGDASPEKAEAHIRSIEQRGGLLFDCWG